MSQKHPQHTPLKVECQQRAYFYHTAHVELSIIVLFQHVFCYLSLQSYAIETIFMKQHRLTKLRWSESWSHCESDWGSFIKYKKTCLWFRVCKDIYSIDNDVAEIGFLLYITKHNLICEIALSRSSYSSFSQTKWKLNQSIFSPSKSLTRKNLFLFCELLLFSKHWS